MQYIHHEDLQNTKLDRSNFTPSKISIRGIDINPETLSDYLAIVGYDLPIEYAEAFCDCFANPSAPLTLSEVPREEKDLTLIDKKFYQVFPEGVVRRIRIREEISLCFCDSNTPIVYVRAGENSLVLEIEVDFSSKSVSSNTAWNISESLVRMRSAEKLEGREVAGVDGEFAVNEYITVKMLHDLEEHTLPPVIDRAYLVPENIRIIGASSDVERTAVGVFGSKDAMSFIACGAIEAMKESLDEIEETPFSMLSNLRNQTNPISFEIHHSISLVSQDSYDATRFKEFEEDGDICELLAYEAQKSDDMGDEFDIEFELECNEDSEFTYFRADFSDSSIGEFSVKVGKDDESGDSIIDIGWNADLTCQEKIWEYVFGCAKVLGVNDLQARIQDIPRPDVVDNSMTACLFIEGDDYQAELWLKPVFK